mmetsp:Transcript_99075/g.319442  ORF Transcript_99075/g.319442 Transcript_99075/m.319442 type:complete len:213 (-) Transcript_99075:549-1187(-)
MAQSLFSSRLSGQSREGRRLKAWGGSASATHSAALISASSGPLCSWHEVPSAPWGGRKADARSLLQSAELHALATGGHLAVNGPRWSEHELTVPSGGRKADVRVLLRALATGRQPSRLLVHPAVNGPTRSKHGLTSASGGSGGETRPLLQLAELHALGTGGQPLWLVAQLALSGPVWSKHEPTWCSGGMETDARTPLNSAKLHVLAADEGPP